MRATLSPHNASVAESCDQIQPTRHRERQPPATDPHEALLAGVILKLLNLEDTNRLDEETQLMLERMPYAALKKLDRQLPALPEQP